IAYTWTEQNVPGYTISGETVTGNTTVITNRYRPEEETEEEVPTTSATVVKIWDDDDNEHHRRPNHLRVTLSNGTSYDLNAGNNWSVTVEDLPAERNGQPIVYTWSEQSVPGYKLVGTTVSGNTTVFTNRYREVVVPSNDPNGNKKTGTPATFIDDYETPLGVGVTINHVGDCFE
ncbi:MAG: Cna B-type domain-containing protein, partial [Clostridiales bacterium]|nr:Cna B-type domain-containing protein [Clostridiales bacterium]